MINIAICDDDIKMTSYIECLVNKTALEEAITTNISIYFDGGKLVKGILRGERYDIIYLDIEMNDMSGIAVAEYLRKNNIASLIIFISAYENYIKEVFAVEPFGFMIKPILEKEFRDIFVSAYDKLRKQPEFYTYSYNKSIFRVSIYEILYFESHNRTVLVHLANGETGKFYGKLNAVEKQMERGYGRYLRIHQSYLVNFDFVRVFNYKTVQMSNQDILAISPERQKSIRKQFCMLADYEVTE